MGFLLAQWWGTRLPMQKLQETKFYPWVRKIPWRRKGQTHSSILAWKIPCTEDHDRLQPMLGSQRVRHDWACTLACMQYVMGWVLLLLLNLALGIDQQPGSELGNDSLWSHWSPDRAPRSKPAQARLEEPQASSLVPGTWVPRAGPRRYTRKQPGAGGSESGSTFRGEKAFVHLWTITK